MKSKYTTALPRALQADQARGNSVVRSKRSLRAEENPLFEANPQLKIFAEEWKAKLQALAGVSPK